MQRTTDTFSSAVLYFFVRPLSPSLGQFCNHSLTTTKCQTPLSTSRLLAPSFSRDVQSMQRMAHQCRTTKSS